MKTIRQLGRILDRRFKFKLTVLLIGIVFGALLETLALSLISPFISVLLDHAYLDENAVMRAVFGALGLRDAQSVLILLAFLLAALYFAKGVYAYLLSRLQYRIIGNGWIQLAERLIRRVLEQPFLFHARTNAAALQKLVTDDVNSFFNAAVTPILQLLTEGMLLLFIGVFLFAVSFKMTLLVALMVSLCVLFYFTKFRRKIIAWGGESYARYVLMIKTANQAFGGVKELKVLRREGRFADVFVENVRRFVAAWRQHTVNSSILRLSVETVCFGGTFLFIGLVMLWGADVAPLVPKLSIFILAAFRMLPSVTRGGTYVNSVLHASVIIDTVHENLFGAFHFAGAAADAAADGESADGEAADEAAANAKSDAADEAEGANGAANAESDAADGAAARDETGANGADEDTDTAGERAEPVVRPPDPRDITVRNLSFTYPGGRRPVLDDVSLTIPHRSAVAFVGPSGAGKTTLADLILGVLPPAAGRIEHDGFDIREDPERWSRRVGYIPQQIFLLDETIAENILFGVPDGRDDARIRAALKKARLDDFVRDLPEGLEAVVGDRGIRLSGGQRQRIGIARALYDDAPILVLDEATSSLDNETEAAVMEAVMGLRGDKTLIIIAHRLSTIRYCDIVYRVEGGKVTRTR